MQTIETARVYLRPFTVDDLDAFAAIGSDPDVMRYIGAGRPLSKEETHARLNTIIEHRDKHGFGVWAAVDRSNGTLMGYCGLQFLENTSEVEVGYRLAKRFWGMGIASEAARASLRYGFEELSLGRIVAVVQPGNIASQHVLEKIGLRYVRDARFYNTHVKYYAITLEEYERDGSTWIR
jgi:ribosomal-protein-alanine N-acetyltransferase